MRAHWPNDTHAERIARILGSIGSFGNEALKIAPSIIKYAPYVLKAMEDLREWLSGKKRAKRDRELAEDLGTGRQLARIYDR